MVKLTGLSNMAFHLSFLLVVTGITGIHCITTVSHVSAKTGGSITIPCQYHPQYENHVKYLCVGYYWNHCDYAVKTYQRRSGRYSIFDDKNHRIFNVTIHDLKSSDSGYYWCAVEINNGGDVKTFFHLSVRDTQSLYVDHQEIRAFEGGNTTINCYFNSGEMRWCKLGGPCVTFGLIDGATVTIKPHPNGSSVTMSGLRMENSGWYWCAKGNLQMPVHVAVSEPSTTNETTNTGQSDMNSTSFNELQIYIYPLILLIVIAMLALFIWFMLKRRKQAEANPSATVEDEVTYTTVTAKKRTPGQGSDAVSDVDVTYSTVTIVNR